MDIDIRYSSIMPVIQSWELARQRHGFDELLGIQTIMLLFQKNSKIKKIFGFDVHKEIKPYGMQRMGLLIHGLRLVSMMDKAFQFLGPDFDDLVPVLESLGRKHRKFGVKPSYFPLMCDTMIEVISECLGDEWSPELEVAWTEVLHGISNAIVGNMKKKDNQK